MSTASSIEAGVGQILGSAPIETAAADVTAFVMAILAKAGEVANPALAPVIGSLETVLAPIAELEVKSLLSAAAAKLEGATPPATGSVAQALGAVETTIATEVEAVLDTDGAKLIGKV